LVDIKPVVGERKEKTMTHPETKRPTTNPSWDKKVIYTVYDLNK